MKRSRPLRRTTQLRAGKRLAARSAKRVLKDEARRLLRARLLMERRTCEIGPILAAAGEPEATKCNGAPGDLHEVVKRSRGGSALDEANILVCCRPCHDFTEREPLRAATLGLLRSRPPGPASRPVEWTPLGATTPEEET